jgi:uncharacterized protein YpbB
MRKYLRATEISKTYNLNKQSILGRMRDLGMNSMLGCDTDDLSKLLSTNTGRIRLSKINSFTIIHLHNEGFSIEQISKSTSLKKSTVSRHIEEWLGSGYVIIKSKINGY